jgi:hypothetical protein
LRLGANYVPACGSGANGAGNIIAGGQSAAHAGRHTLKVEDLEHVEDILRTRTGSSGDSRPSTQAVQRPMGSQGSTNGMRGRRAGSGNRGGRIGGRKARARRGANHSERGGNARAPSDDDRGANEQLWMEISRELYGE